YDLSNAAGGSPSLFCHPDDLSIARGGRISDSFAPREAGSGVRIARLGRATLLRRLLRERDLRHVVALLNLIDRVHPLNHAAEDRVLAVESRLRLEADVELAAARIALRINFVSRARGGDTATQVLLFDFGRHGVTWTASASAV